VANDEELFQTNELSRPASTRMVLKAQQQVEKGDLSTAAKTLQRAIDLDPQPAALLLLGDIFMKLRQPERAIIPLAAAVTLDQGSRAKAALANVFMRLRREREAHAMAELALKDDPSDRLALEVLEATREGE
jgi:tetratricopeptide (TPR) repeat protein